MIVRRGRPGLIGTMARTAAVAGTATAVSDRVRQRQAAPATVDVAAEIEKLADLKAAGALSEEEFAAAKAKLLA